MGRNAPCALLVVSGRQFCNCSAVVLNIQAYNAEEILGKDNGLKLKGMQGNVYCQTIVYSILLNLRG